MLVMCFVLCYFVIKILGLEGSVTTNAHTSVLGIDPKCGLPSLRSVSEILV